MRLLPSHEAQAAREHVLSDDGIVVVRLVENSVVMVASTVHGVEPVSSADRYSRTERKRVKVPRPNIVAQLPQHNEFMGGTDQMNSNVGAYRILICGKKWWWPIFSWLCEVAINKGWALIRSSGSTISQLDFQREVAQTYLMRSLKKPKGAGRPCAS